MEHDCGHANDSYRSEWGDVLACRVGNRQDDEDDPEVVRVGHGVVRCVSDGGRPMLPAFIRVLGRSRAPNGGFGPR